MTFWNWLRREKPEDKVLLELKDRRIKALEETITTMDAEVAVLRESNTVLKLLADATTGGRDKGNP